MSELNGSEKYCYGLKEALGTGSATVTFSKA